LNNIKGKKIYYKATHIQILWKNKYLIYLKYSSPYVSWSYGMVFVVKVSLILFITFSPKRIGSPARNFSFQKGWFESSLSMTRVRKVFLYHWKSLSFLHLRLERSSTFLSFKWEGSPTKCKEIVRIRVDTASWIVFPDGSRMGVWSSYVWKEYRIYRWLISVR